jgi:hypothetical protein
MRPVNILPAFHPTPPFAREARELGFVAGGSAIAIAVAGVGMTPALPGWCAMWIIAVAEFAALKLLTLRGTTGECSGWKIAAYLALWPGMNARTFLHGRFAGKDRPRRLELGFAIMKLGLGLGLMAWATLHAARSHAMIVGWTGMLGLIFTLHFGALHVLSWIWRRAGFVAPAIMRAPLAARSLAELWGARWNLAFAEPARRFLLRPLARRWGGRRAGAVVFLVSGLIHETVVSLPARGGWGGPTLYFLLQGAGVVIEKSAIGVRAGLGHGIRGWCWTLLVAAAPLPLLFHAPFVREVIVPFYRALSPFLP